MRELLICKVRFRVQKHFAWISRMKKAILPSGDTGIPNQILAKDGLLFSLNKRLQVLSTGGVGSFCHMARGNSLPVFEWKFLGIPVSPI